MVGSRGRPLIQIKFKGLKQIITSVNKTTKKTTDAEKGLPYKLALRLKKRIREEILKLGHARHQGHNTPSPLLDTLHGPKKEGKGYSVAMERRGRGVNPLWIEEGTKPHTIPKNPKEGQKVIFHPGATPKHPFRNGIARFNTEDLDKILDKELKTIMK